MERAIAASEAAQRELATALHERLGVAEGWCASRLGADCDAAQCKRSATSLDTHWRRPTGHRAHPLRACRVSNGRLVSTFSTRPPP